MFSLEQAPKAVQVLMQRMGTWEGWLPTAEGGVEIKRPSRGWEAEPRTRVFTRADIEAVERELGIPPLNPDVPEYRREAVLGHYTIFARSEGWYVYSCSHASSDNTLSFSQVFFNAAYDERRYQETGRCLVWQRRQQELAKLPEFGQ